MGRSTLSAIPIDSSPSVDDSAHDVDLIGHRPITTSGLRPISPPKGFPWAILDDLLGTGRYSSSVHSHSRPNLLALLQSNLAALSKWPPSLLSFAYFLNASLLDLLL